MVQCNNLHSLCTLFDIDRSWFRRPSGMVRWTRHGRKQWWQTHSPTRQLCSNQKRGSLVCSRGSSSSWSRDRKFSRRIQYCGFHQAPQWRHWNAESKRYELCLPFLKGSSWFTDKDINYIYIVLDIWYVQNGEMFSKNKTLQTRYCFALNRQFK